ncbi:hypothetical protein HAX54_038502 [Datura stramonium]|uniref:Uncharacterized protein n=1 Tax=Datura stramonium TaxID=4076 RepID=A0ABS8SHZ4_DATST|nr:hypothetical protein [Datura stramonium]
MRIISQFLKLEVLKLKANAVAQEEWEVTETGFPELKFLLLEDLPLQYCSATDDSFPCLEHVIIRNYICLEEIPEGFAKSMTLPLIELHGCSPSLATIAKQIQKDQENFGNNIFNVHESDTDAACNETTEEDIRRSVERYQGRNCGNVFWFSCPWEFCQKIQQEQEMATVF